MDPQQSMMPQGNLQYPETVATSQRSPYRVSMVQPNDGKRLNLESSMSCGQRDSKVNSNGLSSTFEPKRTDYQHGISAVQNRRIGCGVSEQSFKNCLQEQQQFARSAYMDSSIRFPAPSSSWQMGNVFGPMGRDYNYGHTPRWNTGTGNILNSLARNSTPGYLSTSNVLSMNSSRMRPTKESNVVTGMRNCETPHLGKVNYSPNTVSNLECSNCGLAGSMFKCLGCEVAFYCDQNCQVRHWSRHVISCPKKMPKLKKVVH